MPSVLVLDTALLAHFARADRLDVLRELLVGDECRTTYVVLDELRRGLPEHPDQRAVLELEWVMPIELDERCRGTAITDDQSATRVARRNGLAEERT